MSKQQFALEMVQVAPVSGCWLWQRSIDRAGYARIGARYMHREVYELHCGPIPAGLHLDHLCRVRHCVNPDHLEPVTQAENNLRAWAANQTDRCQRGHDLANTDNVYRRKNGGRLCRPCALLRAASSRRAAA
jgi:hypothetical protein